MTNEAANERFDVMRKELRKAQWRLIFATVRLITILVLAALLIWSGENEPAEIKSVIGPYILGAWVIGFLGAWREK